MTDALKLRSNMIAGIIQGTEKPAAAILRLQANSSPSGLKIDHDAELAFAAIDIGQRLIAAGKPIEAELFFRLAEKSLVIMTNKTPDTAASEKGQYLSHLALIRTHYLNNAAQAKLDLDAAQKLLPGDKYLDSLRSALGSQHGDVFNANPAKN